MDTGDFESTNAAAFLLSTETRKTVFIAVRDDDLPEADETFTFNLTVQVRVPSPQEFMYMCLPFLPSRSSVCAKWIDNNSPSHGPLELRALFPQSPTVLILPVTVLNPNPSYEAIESGGVTS